MASRATPLPNSIWIDELDSPLLLKYLKKWVENKRRKKKNWYAHLLSSLRSVALSSFHVLLCGRRHCSCFYSIEKHSNLDFVFIGEQQQCASRRYQVNACDSGQIVSQSFFLFVSVDCSLFACCFARDKFWVIHVYLYLVCAHSTFRFTSSPTKNKNWLWKCAKLTSHQLLRAREWSKERWKRWKTINEAKVFKIDWI